MAQEFIISNPLICKLQELITSEIPEKSNAIIWLQGNKYDRGEKVLELYHKGFAPLIVVTGNSIRVVEDDDIHIDDVMDWLKDRGIDKSAILVDDQSINTLDQAQHVVAIAQERLWKKILLVGSTYHQLRVFLTFLKQARVQGWQGRIINQPAHIDWEAKPSGRSKTAQELFQEETEKAEKYKENIATVEKGIEYFKNEQYARR